MLALLGVPIRLEGFSIHADEKGWHDMKAENLWQVAFALACALAAALWWGKGSLQPVADAAKKAWKDLGIPDLVDPGPSATDETFDYGEPTFYPTTDATGGVLGGCDGCGPQSKITFFGTPAAQAAWLASQNR